MTMFLMPMAIADMAKMAILAIMVTIAMANANFCMDIRGIQLESTKKLAQWC